MLYLFIICQTALICLFPYTVRVTLPTMYLFKVSGEWGSLAWWYPRIPLEGFVFVSVSLPVPVDMFLLRVLRYGWIELD